MSDKTRLAIQSKRIVIWETEHLSVGDILLLHRLKNKIHIVNICGGGIGNSWASLRKTIKVKRESEAKKR